MYQTEMKRWLSVVAFLILIGTDREEVSALIFSGSFVLDCSFGGPEIINPAIVFFAKAPRIPFFVWTVLEEVRCGHGDDFCDLSANL